MESKRQRLGEGGAAADDSSTLSDALSKLAALVTQGGSEAEGLDGVLEQLGRLQAKLNGTSRPAFQAIEDAQAKLQAAVVALQAAVDRLTPPPGYRPPALGDEASVRSLLSYAHRLSYSSSAPLGYQPGQPLYFFKPPAPQEAEMRASQLHAFAREWEEREQAREAKRQAAALGAAVPAAAAATAAPAAGAGAPPATGDLAALAAQHGLDVKQLLASMPPGWKPGDPISLGPPTAGGAAAAAPAPAAAAPAVATQQQQQALPASAQAPAAMQRDVSPEAAAPPAAPRLAGLFLNELNFEEYDYMSEDDEEESSEDDSSDQE